MAHNGKDAPSSSAEGATSDNVDLAHAHQRRRDDTGRDQSMVSLGVLHPLHTLTNFLRQYFRDIKSALGLSAQKTQVERVLVLLLESGCFYSVVWVSFASRDAPFHSYLRPID